MNKIKLYIILLVALSIKTIAQTCIPPSVPYISASSDTLCSGQSATLAITSGLLNSATSWQWYSSGCGSLSVGAGTQVVVNPLVTTTYYVRGEGGCVTPSTCSTILPVF